MSSSEKGGGPSGLPPEAVVASSLTPSPSTLSAVSSTPVSPTPGLAMAAARVPGGPTLPDWDPASLGLVIGRMANELFQAPPSAHPGGVDVTGVSKSSPPPQPSFAPQAPPTSMQPPFASTPPEPALSAASPPAGASAPMAPDAALPSSPFGGAPSFDAVLPPELAELASFRFPLVDVVDPSLTEDPALVAPPEATLDPVSQPTYQPAYEVAPVTREREPVGGMFDAHAVRREFPILEERIHGRRLVWLDNAATTQKPLAVIERISEFYRRENSNVHRAAHTLAARATDAYESARKTVRRFLNASTEREIIFARGATEGINLVAQSWGRRNVQAGDEIVLTNLEHHANIVPWQMLCNEKGARLRVAPVDDSGQIIIEEYEKLLGPRTRIVAIPQVSNALGTITPTQEMVALAHRHGALALVDGAQAVSHMPVDVQELDCDFYVFSGHKVFAPTGIGVVYGKAKVLESMPPWQGGGNMIDQVTFERTTYQPPPMRFEAGTGNIADAVGLGAALDWLTRLGLPNVDRYEHELLVYATDKLNAVPGLRIIGTAPKKAGVISFTLAGHDPAAVASALDQEGIAVRGGHHCAQPILRRFGLESTVRASFAPYNLCEDVDALAAALHQLQAGRSAPAR
jgi:cysteine desulfurase/selenocysteine lyase